MTVTSRIARDRAYSIRSIAAPAPVSILFHRNSTRMDVEYSVMFLQGKSSALTKKLMARMEKAAEVQEFEKAATIRDQISDLRRIQEQQYVSNQGGDADACGCYFGLDFCRACYLCPKRPDHRKQGIFSPFTTGFRAGRASLSVHRAGVSGR